MTQLYLLQFACCIITSMLALMLALARFQVRWPNRRYELSRWLMVIAMAALSVHYILQMTNGYRAKSDEVGAVVNLLFYTPVSFVFSYATYNIVCQRTHRRHFIVTGFVGYALVLAAFAVGVYASGSIGRAVYAMIALFAAYLLYFIYSNITEIIRHRKVMLDDSGIDMMPFDSFAGSCFVLICISMLTLTASLLSRSLLLVFGPLMIFSLFAFVVSFIGYGFNLKPADTMLDDADTMPDGTGAPSTADSGACPPDSAGNTVRPLTAERAAAIERTLYKWSREGGYSDSTLNMASLSVKTGIPRAELSVYFERHLNSTFRVWLSNLRFEVAKQMLCDNPNYSNDAISTECGFSSHGHLYRVFKANTGMTPGQWKVSHSHQ